MIELSVNNLTKYYGANKIFQGISFEVKSGERLGLIGQNGCGKTTIMKILMGDEDYQEGEITLRKDVKLGYLNQIPVYGENITIMDVLRSAFDEVFRLKLQMEQLEKQFLVLEGKALEKAIASYDKLNVQYELQDGYEIETKINRITEGLQINDAMKEMLFQQLSGGEKTRIILGKILLEGPDILLLDEPTNHLDLMTIEWLEGFLKDYQGAVIIISHDRYFLDRVVGRIVELEYNRANVYNGNYSYYVTEKERRFLVEYHNYQNQQKKIEQMEQQIQRFRIWGEMRDSEKMFKRAKELEKRLEKIEVMERPILDKRKIRLGKAETGRSGKMVLSVEKLGKGFGDKNIFQGAELQLYYQDSACIIGRNGSGKSTLLKMVMGEFEADAGVIKIGAQVKIGYLPQEVSYEDEELTVLEYFAYYHNVTYEVARAQLARVLFLKEDVYKKIKMLSGGEKSRLKLCSLTFEGANLLILDEPTNHLDIDSIEVLEETLLEFEGTILFVSHDRYFINKVADKMMEIENNIIKTYDGDYSYYLEENQKEREKYSENKIEKKNHKTIQKEETYKSLQKSTPNKSTSNKSTTILNKRLEFLETEIESMEVQLKRVEKLMEIHGTEVGRLRELFEEKLALENKLAIAYEDWEVLQIS